MRAEDMAIHLGRLIFRKHWETVLTETLYAIAPRGSWNEADPRWKAARRVLEGSLTRKSVAWLAGNRSVIQGVVGEQSRRALTEHEIVLAARFFETPGGQIWRDRRQSLVRERTYGLPFIEETLSLEQVKLANAALEKALLELPEEREGKEVYDFFQSPLGDKVLKLQNSDFAEVTANIFRSEMDAIVLRDLAELKNEVRAGVPAMPAETDKVYLGSVVMGKDGSYEVTIEHRKSMRLVGTYQLTFRSVDPQWADIAAAVPDMKPAERRFLYRSPEGALGDRP